MSCPTCSKSDGYFNISRDHYGFCDIHKTAWYLGSNLFTDWRDEDPSLWQFNRKRLARYAVVDVAEGGV